MRNLVRPTYVIAGGYTAGHITPGFAIAAALPKIRPDLDLLFMGATGGMEETLARREGMSFVGLHAGPWVGQSLRGRSRTLRLLGPAVLAARQKLRACGAVGLTALGGFASVAPGLAAWSLDLPVTLYEPNAKLGLANRLLRPFSSQLLVSGLFETSHRSLDVGVPLRTPAPALPPSPPAAGDDLRVFVFGGSLGNPFFNEHMPATLAKLKSLTGRPLRVVHQCGINVDPAPVAGRYQSAGVTAEVHPFIHGSVHGLATAHLVISTAGAISLHELAAVGIPSLIIPLGGVAEPHQLANARAFARATDSLMRPQHDWSVHEVAAELAGVLLDPSRWQKHSKGLRRLSRPQATRDFIDALLADLPAKR